MAWKRETTMKRGMPGPRILSRKGEEILEKAIEAGQLALASQVLEQMAKIVGCWPQTPVASPTMKAARLVTKQTPAKEAAAAARPPLPPPMTMEAWEAAFVPKT